MSIDEKRPNREMAFTVNDTLYCKFSLQVESTVVEMMNSECYCNGEDELHN